MLKSSLCDYSDAQLPCKETIKINGAERVGDSKTRQDNSKTKQQDKYQDKQTREIQKSYLKNRHHSLTA